MAPFYESEIETILLRQLFQCSHELNRKMDESSSQRRVLALIDHGEDFNQKQLAELMDVRQPSMSELLTKLENKGYILKQKEDGSRTISIKITPEGKTELTRMQEEHNRLLRGLFSGLDAQERRDTSALLDKLLRSWGVNPPG